VRTYKVQLQEKTNSRENPQSKKIDLKHLCYKEEDRLNKMGE